PSYLFGTMHLNDRRLFHFSDSLYNFLHQANEFAMEIDVEELNNAIINFNSNDTAVLLKEVKQEQYKKLALELESTYGIPADKVTKKQAWLYKQMIQAPGKTRAGEMNVFVDIYLYNIAKKNGKKLSGIEKIEDQMELYQDFGDGLVVKNKFFKKIEKELMEKLVKTYINQDLNAINEWFKMMEPSERFKVLTKRNLNMADRIEVMSGGNSCFFAIGAAHLPGDDGLIELLITMGFKLEPVFSKKKLSPRKYQFTKEKMIAAL
ncbi:MAG: TraB/GumN family protein, partial [Chitinophagaceae bacterium]